MSNIYFDEPIQVLFVDSAAGPGRPYGAHVLYGHDDRLDERNFVFYHLIFENITKRAESMLPLERASSNLPDLHQVQVTIFVQYFDPTETGARRRIWYGLFQQVLV